jgi:hypothetical protein
MALINTIITAGLASVATGSIVGYITKQFISRTIDHHLKLTETKQNIIWQNEIAYRKAQLEELYGPIYSMLKTNAVIYRLWLDKKLPEVNFDIKKYFESNNVEIRRILTEKMHLIDGGEMPPQFIDFMTSAMIWNWYCAKDPYASFPSHVEALQEVKWPVNFEKYVYIKTEELKQRLNELYQKNAIK